jgi:TRAP-type mannitol/chloroaromatic compound transport system permease small subunit
MLLVLLSLLVVYELVMRYFFQAGSVAIQELQWHLFDIVFLLAFTYTQAQKGHVRVDIFYTHYSPKAKQIVDLISMVLIALPFVLVMFYFSLDFMMMSYGQHEGSSDPGGLCCRFIIKGFITLSLALLALQLTIQSIEEYKALRGSRV